MYASLAPKTVHWEGGKESVAPRHPATSANDVAKTRAVRMHHVLPAVPLRQVILSPVGHSLRDKDAELNYQQVALQRRSQSTYQSGIAMLTCLVAEVVCVPHVTVHRRSKYPLLPASNEAEYELVEPAE